MAQLTYTAVDLPTGLSLDANTGLILGTLEQTGIFNVEITADDGTESATIAFQWFVSVADSEVGTVAVPQAGSPVLLAGNDFRGQETKYRNGYLYTAQTVSCDGGGGVVNGTIAPPLSPSSR